MARVVTVIVPRFETGLVAEGRLAVGLRECLMVASGKWCIESTYALLWVHSGQSNEKAFPLRYVWSFHAFSARVACVSVFFRGQGPGRWKVWGSCKLCRGLPYASHRMAS